MNASAPIPLGTKQLIDGQERVFYYGYWIKTYEAPADTLSAKKRLIEALTRRLFNHVEHGINVPGSRLAEARAAYDGETDAELRRVKGAMLAGALFNRAADIFTKLVDLQACGVEIAHDNALMRECGHCLQEALNLGKLVRHRSGEEGIDELWGEPFKAFSIPVEAFYESRYIKIAQTMRDLDQITAAIVSAFEANPMFAEVVPLAKAYGEVARLKTETLRTDADVFDVWAQFAVAQERLEAFQPRRLGRHTEALEDEMAHGLRLIGKVSGLVSDITRARVPMPKSTAKLIENLQAFAAASQAASVAPFGQRIAL